MERGAEEKRALPVAHSGIQWHKGVRHVQPDGLCSGVGEEHGGENNHVLPRAPGRRRGQGLQMRSECRGVCHYLSTLVPRWLLPRLQLRGGRQLWDGRLVPVWCVAGPRNLATLFGGARFFIISALDRGSLAGFSSLRISLLANFPSVPLQGSQQACATQCSGRSQLSVWRGS
jgi:hypothetical protein